MKNTDRIRANTQNKAKLGLHGFKCNFIRMFGDERLEKVIVYSGKSAIVIDSIAHPHYLHSELGTEPVPNYGLADVFRIRQGKMYSQ